MSNDPDVEPEAIKTFRNWFISNGGEIHPSVRFCPDETGYSVKSDADLPADTTVFSCPFNLAITPETIKAHVEHYCDFLRESEPTARQLICTYIALHSIIQKDNKSLLNHQPYLDILPKADKLFTPLYFTTDELNIFHGTNLHGAALSQKSIWEKEWETVRSCISSVNPKVSEVFTWDMYLAGATFLSSRAFPSTLLSSNPSLIVTPSSHQVLLPGVDSLNHARGKAVTWGVSRCNAPSQLYSDLCIQLTLNTPYADGSELFNNYGPKPNSSLILSYGFAIEDNPDDTIMLKIGSRGGPNGQSSEKSSTSAKIEHEIGRDARGADALWDDVLSLVAAEFSNDEDEDKGTEAESSITQAAREVRIKVQTADTLSNMVSDLLDRLPILPEGGLSSFRDDDTKKIRPNVRKMWIYYVQGQVDILNSLLAWIEEKEREAVRLAEELGIVVSFEEDSDGSD